MSFLPIHTLISESVSLTSFISVGNSAQEQFYLFIFHSALNIVYAQYFVMVGFLFTVDKVH